MKSLAQLLSGGVAMNLVSAAPYRSFSGGTEPAPKPNLQPLNQLSLHLTTSKTRTSGRSQSSADHSNHLPASPACRLSHFLIAAAL
jgi:hypothetical protein